DRAELGLPVAQDIGLHRAQARGFADLEKRLVWNPGCVGRLGSSSRQKTLVSGSPVERVLQHLARLERQHATRADRDLLSGLRISPGARVLVAYHEVAEAGNFDLLAALERFLDRVEHRLHDLRRLFLRKPADLLVHVLNNVGLRHDPRAITRISLSGQRASKILRLSLPQNPQSVPNLRTTPIISESKSDARRQAPTPRARAPRRPRRQSACDRRRDKSSSRAFPSCRPRRSADRGSPRA